MDRFKLVARFDTLIDAQTTKSLLESYHINSHIPEEHAGNIMPHLTIAMNGIRLMVPEEQYSDALEVIKKHQKRTSLIVVEDEFEIPQKTNRYAVIFISFLVLTLLIFFVIYKFIHF